MIRAAALLALAFGASSLSGGAQAPAPVRSVADGSDSIESEVAQWVASAAQLSPYERETRLARITAFGSPAAELLLSVWNDPATAAESRPLLLETLRTFPERAVIHAIDLARKKSDGVADRCGWLEVLGEVGRADAIDVALDVLVVPGEPSGAARLSRTLSSALPRILSRDPRALERLEQASRSLDPQREALVIEALVRSPSSGAARIAVEALRLHANLAEPALRALAEMARCSWVWLDEGHRAELRHWLDASEPTLKKCAAVALARLHDPEAALAMLGWLEREDERDRKTAAWCLETILGVSLPPELRRWRALCDEEIAWKERRGRRCIAVLASRNPTTVVDAIGELSRARLHRHDVAAELAPLVSSANPGIRAAACAALARLGSACAIPALIDALDESDEARRTCALDALRTLTGRDLPAQADEWRRLVGI